MRRWVRGNASSEQPAAHVALHIMGRPVPTSDQSGQFCHLLECGVASYWRVEKGVIGRRDAIDFMDHNTLWNWMLRKTHDRIPLWVWAHRMSDVLLMSHFWQMLDGGEFALWGTHDGPAVGNPDKHKVKLWQGCLVTNDPPTIVVCRTAAGATVRFLDSRNWVNADLRETASLVGCHLPNLPGEIAGMDDRLEFARAAARAVETTAQRVMAFVGDYDMGQFRATAASQAMHWWRHRHMDCAVCTDDDPEVKATERAAYFGARKAVYFNGAVAKEGLDWAPGMAGVPPKTPAIYRGPVYRLDICGAYPSVMRGNLYPTRYVQTMVRPEPAALLARMRGFCAIADVTVSSGYQTYPKRLPDGPVWALGTFGTTLCGDELKAALETADVKAVHVARLYSAGRPFDSLVNEGWALRWGLKLAGRELEHRLVKHLMNALHGKFGERSHPWELVPGQLAPQPWGTYWKWDNETRKSSLYRAVGGWEQRAGEAAERPDSFPGVAAYVTMYLRRLMDLARQVAGQREALYEDADSLHVTSTGYKRMLREGMIAKDALGKFRVEQVAEFALYGGPGMYRLDDYVVMPGRSVNGRLLATGEWSQDNYSRLDSLLCSCPPPGPVSAERVSVEPMPIIRGRVADDGWVHPLKLER